MYGKKYRGHLHIRQKMSLKNNLKKKIIIPSLISGKVRLVCMI